MLVHEVGGDDLWRVLIDLDTSSITEGRHARSPRLEVRVLALPLLDCRLKLRWRVLVDVGRDIPRRSIVCQH